MADDEIWSECKHGMKSGCAYCHVTSPGASRPTTVPTTVPKKRAVRAPLGEKMNDRMTALNKRLKAIRGK